MNCLTKRKTDVHLQNIIQTVTAGWPDSKSNLCDDTQNLWNIRHELSEIGGIVYKANHMLVPSALREVIQLAHEGHLGISQRRSRIREYY